MDDEYYITASSLLGWQTEPQAGTVSAAVGSLVYLYFDVTIPERASDVDIISYTVVSDSDPSVFVSGEVSLESLITAADDGDMTSVPDRLALAQNYPNPFNPTTTIAFNLPGRSIARLEVYDVLGRTVDILNLGSLAGGPHEIQYDASSMASGVYFYRLTTDFGNETRKMILLK